MVCALPTRSSWISFTKDKESGKKEISIICKLALPSSPIANT